MTQHTQAHNLKIDYLRGIAICGVFIYHYQAALFGFYIVDKYDEDGLIKVSGLRQVLINFSPISLGWSGVTLFFVISGFLIHSGFLKNQTDFNLAEFFSKRCWRIFPAYWLALIIFSFFISYGSFFPFTSWKDFLIHFFALHDFFKGMFYSINGSFWSLAVEVHMYCLYPLFLMLRRRLGINRTFLLAIILSVVKTLCGFMYDGFSMTYQFPIIDLWYVWIAGAWLAENYFNGVRIIKRNSLILFVTLFGATLLSKIFSYTTIFSYLIATFSCVVFAEWFLFKANINLKSFVSRWMIIVGLCSYSIYLFHQPLMMFLIYYFSGGLFSFITSLLAILPVFLVIFLFAWMSYQFMELPYIELGRILRLRRRSKKTLDTVSENA